MNASSVQANSNPLSPIEKENDPASAGNGVDTKVQGNDAEVNGEMDDEGHVPKVFTSPGQPSAIAMAKHKCTHIPFRSWCKHCVRGRGRDRQHRLITGAEGASNPSAVPRVVMDYGFFSTNNQGEDCEDDVGTIKMTMLIVKETMCGSVWGYCVRHKGILQEPWIAKQLVYDFDTIGLASERIIVKNDQEVNIVALQHDQKTTSSSRNGTR